MAAKKKPVRKSFYEVVFRGKPKVVRAFLKGFVIGTVDDAVVFFSFTDGIHHEGKAEKLAELVGLRRDDCHVVVDSRTSAQIKKHKRRIEEETGLVVTSHRAVRSASMAFQYKAFASRYDRDILAMVRKLPAGLRLRGFKHDVREDPDARGIEAYSPAHHFEATGSGTITGRVDLLVALKKSLADYPLIKAQDIVLKHR